jgi:hypothetical protein
MQIYYVDDNGARKPLDENKNSKLTPESLREKIDGMAVMAELEVLSPSRGIVRVHKGMGTTMFLASAEDNLEWLKSRSIKKEDKGSVTVYHVVFD